MGFFVILGSRKGLFEGLNRAMVVIHLKGCITTTKGGFLGEFERKMVKKSAKNENVGC